MKKSAVVATVKTAKKTASDASDMKPADTDEIARTIRMPRHLWVAASEHSRAMTSKGRGRWSTNLVVVDAITQASKRWEGQKAGE